MCPPPPLDWNTNPEATWSLNIRLFLCNKQNTQLNPFSGHVDLSPVSQLGHTDLHHKMTSTPAWSWTTVYHPGLQWAQTLVTVLHYHMTCSGGTSPVFTAVSARQRSHFRPCSPAMFSAGNSAPSNIARATWRDVTWTLPARSFILR